MNLAFYVNVHTAASVQLPFRLVYRQQIASRYSWKPNNSANCITSSYQAAPPVPDIVVATVTRLFIQNGDTVELIISHA